MSKALYNWFPSTSRGFAKSAIWMSARLMGGLTPLIWVLIVELGGLSWRGAMWLFAACAAIWCVVFYFAFTNKPGEHSKVGAAELAEIDAGRAVQTGVTQVPWAALLRSRQLWAVCFMYVVTNFCWYFLMYNLPGRLKDAYKDWNATDGGKLLLALLAGAPLLVGMAGCLLGGAVSDWYIRRTGDRKWGRRLLGMVGYAGAGACYLIAAAVYWYWPDNLWPFAIMLMLMGFFNDLIMAPAWATCQDIGRHYAATVSGTMNMFGNLVGAVSGIFFTGMVMTSSLGQTQKIATCFATYAAVYFVGVGIWMLIDASKPIVPEAATAPPPTEPEGPLGAGELPS
jgi:sugar phosphate permease